jgi:hypothetical protein
MGSISAATNCSGFIRARRAARWRRSKI